MRPAIKYGPRVDSLTIDAKDDVKIAVSSCVENCLVVDFRSENNPDVVEWSCWRRDSCSPNFAQ